MNELQKVLKEGETILAQAEISKTFYNGIISLYLLGFVLLFIGYEYEIGVIGVVLIVRTFYMHIQAIQEKKSYHCFLTEKRLIILKGRKIKEVFPIKRKYIRTIYIKPFTKRFSKLLDVGTLEVITNYGGRYVIRNIKMPYSYHRAIIGDIVSATHYSNTTNKA